METEKPPTHKLVRKTIILNHITMIKKVFSKMKKAIHAVP